jgi:Right handed beta helix region
MRYSTALILSACVMGSVTAVHADSDVVDCSHRSLAAAVRNADDQNLTIRFTGVCAGPIAIQTDGLVLQGVGTAVIDGGGAADVVTVSGASRVSLADFEVRNGVSGILGVNGAHLKLTRITSHDNFVFGISLQASSSGEFVDVIASHNGVHGIDVQTGSAAVVRGPLTSLDNRVFGINVNGSSITIAQATVSASGNALGIQIATSASAFLNGANAVINAEHNLSTGLTVVSGAHLVSFGGAINATGNPVAGVSVNSKAGLDLDAGSVLNTFNNGEGVLLQQNSVMTVFNTPQFSGVPGFSTVNAHDNLGNGVRVQRGATLTLTNQARVLSNNNGRTGFVADNGAGVTLVNSTITGNTVKDIQLTFGARADLQTLTFGSYTCDDTVLVRGTAPITCPH